MKSRLCVFLFAFSVIFTLTACGGDSAGIDEPLDSPSVSEPNDSIPEDTEELSNGPSESTAPAPSESEPADGPEESPEVPGPNEEPSVEPSTEPSAEPSIAPIPSESSAQEPSPSIPSPSQDPAPSQDPSPSQDPVPPQPSESGEPDPSEPPAESGIVDLQAFYEGLCGRYEGFNASMAVEGEFLDAYYAGLSDIPVKQRAIYMPMMSSVVCEIALAEVENAADVESVKAIFQARIDSQAGHGEPGDEDYVQGGAWYPASIDAWKNNSRIVSIGNYVLMIAWSGECDQIVDDFSALF